MIKSLIERYTSYLQRRPLYARCLTTSFLVTTGDLTSQYLFENRGIGRELPIEKVRLVRSAALGFFIIAPNLHFWYTLTLPKILGQKFFQRFSPIQKVIAGTVIDQSTFAFWIISNYCFWFSMLKDGDPMKGIENVKNNVPKAIWVNWCIWPFVTAIN